MTSTPAVNFEPDLDCNKDYLDFNLDHIHVHIHNHKPDSIPVYSRAHEHLHHTQSSESHPSASSCHARIRYAIPLDDNDVLHFSMTHYPLEYLISTTNNKDQQKKQMNSFADTFF